MSGVNEIVFFFV